AENATDLIATLTPDGVYRYVSPSCLPLLGYTPDELIGRSATEFFHPDDVNIISQSLQKVIEQPDTTYTLTHRRRHKDGRYIWCETTVHAVRDLKTNKVLEIQAASRDVTQRKQDEDAIKRYAERLELLHDIDRAILKLDQPSTTSESVLKRLQPLTGFDSASVTAFDAEFHEFTILASIAPISHYYPYEDPGIIELLKHGEVYQVADLLSIDELSSSDQALIAAGIRSYVRIPLIAGGKLLGSFHLRALEPNAFSAQDVAIAKEVGAQLAIAIENARLVEVEQRRTNELSALHQASLQLTSSLDVDHVLNLILDYAISLIRGHDAHLFLYDGEKLTFGAALWQGEKRTAPFSEPRTEGLN
ncbi:MAG: PAS domain S-box protein, partial [Anaerolineae bacterium]|nr:PAS domain S-box protein [Anaerolineae bacterium]